MKIVAWIIFIALFIHLTLQNLTLANSGYDLTTLSFAGPLLGIDIIELWARQNDGGTRLLEIARSNVHWDFVFIPSYFSIIVILCNARMQLEQWTWLNEVIRLNFFIALLIAITDIAENLVMLHNFDHHGYVHAYIGTYGLALIKWLLLAWVVSTLLFSKIKHLITSRTT